MSYDNNKLHPVNTSETSPEKKTSLKRKAAALGLAVTALFGVAACGNGVDQVAQAKPVATAEATPRVSPTTAEATTAPTETASPTENADIAFNVEANKHSTYEQFVTRPRAERLAFVLDQYNRVLTDGISSEYLTAVPYGGSAKDTLDTYNPAIPGVVSKDNNGQEIVNQALFAEQYAAAQAIDPNATGNTPADIQLEEKLASGNSYYADAKKDPRYAVEIGIINSSKDAQILTGIDATRVDKFSPLQKGVDKDGQAIEYVDCWVNSDGNTEIQQFVYYTFAGKDNQNHDIWLFAGARKQ